MPNATPLFVALEWHGPLVPTGPFDGVQDFSGPDTVFGSGTDSASIASSISNFTGYIGTGSVALGFDASTYIPQGFSSDAFYALFTSDRITAVGTITYTYDAAPPPTGAVPEPSGWALLLAGFGLTGAILRRRRDAVVA